MKFLSKVLPLLLVILFWGAPALWAQAQFVPPWEPNLAPQWAPIPQVPGVYYVPGRATTSSATAIGSTFTRRAAGIGVIASTAPGRRSSTSPGFYTIGPTYFKSPPGWAKGKKTGWEGHRCRRGR